MTSKGFDCPICLDYYSEEPTTDYFVTTNCGYTRTSGRTGHIFHYNCLLKSVQWESRYRLFDCPICRHQNNFTESLTRVYNIDILPKPDENTFNHEFKFVVLGKFRAGKSSIIKRFVRNVFSEEYIITENVDYIVKSIQIGDKRIKLNLWDTAGQEKYRSVVTTYVRDAFGMIFVYDITDFSTFDAIEDWIKFADDNGPEHTKRILVGNKTDLQGIRQVSTEHAQEFATRNGYSFIESSAKEGHNVPAIFRILATEMLSDPQLLGNADKISYSRVTSEFGNLKFLDRLKYTCC